MPQISKRRLAVLISQHPAINHAVILREVRYLKESLDVFVASISAPDRPLAELSAEEQEEAAATHYIKPQGFRGALKAHAWTLATNPGGYLGGLFYTLRLSGGRPAKALRLVAYFTEALMVGHWMKAESLTHLHVHYSSTVGLLTACVFPIGLSISFHGPDEFNDPAGFWLRQKVEACRFVRAISYYARSQLMRASDRRHWDKIEVVYMGVDPDRFAPRPFRQNPARVEILCVGRLAPVKAQHVLIAAIAELVAGGRNPLLHLVGGGPDRAALETEVKSRGLEDHIIIHGFTPQDELESLYRQADVFALPSFAEGVPGVLMESMAMEIPCVTTWITGVPELIQQEVNGLLVAPSDAHGMATALERLIDDPPLRRKIGQAGRRQIIDRFDLRHNSRRLAQLFERWNHTAANELQSKFQHPRRSRPLP